MLVNSKMELSTICTVYYYFFIALTCNIVTTANTEGYKQGKNIIFSTFLYVQRKRTHNIQQKNILSYLYIPFLFYFNFSLLLLCNGAMASLLTYFMPFLNPKKKLEKQHVTYVNHTLMYYYKGFLFIPSY